MKITNKRTETKNFNNLEQGEVFVMFHGDDVFIKIETKRLIEEENNGYINAINLSTGEAKYFGLGQIVIPVDAELIVR